MNKTDFLKALSDPTRLKIVQLLNQKQALCVCDIISELDQPQPTISRHLNQLKQIGILESERKGTWIWYSISQELPSWGKAVIGALELN
ncbi:MULTISPECIES: ArsR/SmtB family transcription factor [Moraxella]|jgi:ArsR family transcriptional regulator|uniref:HTH-type transcriptional repressor AseR n=1 Tax=Faucicola osloensis TaxID=34062 RepID=A0A0X8K651_FAUOS|nr:MULTISPECIES: metalloregulator ArsR/SmtB family transcription factor [Moraxella]EEV21938.1 transcriptional regulator, ArsR family [Enhydrobacter aerosaccus SK60]RVU80736.1 ArsR family transcriptional regulator [Leucothrix sargassi]AME01169.1 ArsR family transcriptional regulator [Moraxella osloensis]ATR79299.1 transcriptional regulator [Moraxella osloensis]MBD3726573.1 metalloregulator ArsR/SmtB family transcription factor [Moraxella osloensis]